MEILCIYNPKAGGGKAPKFVKEIQTYFKEFDIDAEIVFTKKNYRAVQILSNYELNTFGALIAAGGDGTFFDVLNAYMKYIEAVDIPLGLIPVGTGNSLSRDIAQSARNLKHFVRIIARQKTKLFDIAQVQTPDTKFYFANMMGLGFSVDVTKTALKYKFFGNMAYILGVLINTLKLKTYGLTLKINGFETQKLNNTFITISNSKYSGNDFLLAPKAETDDGKLDLIVVNKINRRKLLKTFPKIFDGSYINYPYVDYYQTDKIELFATQHKVISPDGEIIGALPATVTCIPKAVRILVE